MPRRQSQTPSKTDKNAGNSVFSVGGTSSAERLIKATLHIWERDGRAGISARNLCQIADLPVSAISYHFGGLEQLLSSAQDAALRAAGDWCNAQTMMLGSLPPTDPAALGPILAALIDDWCVNQRGLAFAWRESQLLAARNSALIGAARAWRGLWQDFWAEVLGHFGLERYACVTTQFFDGQSMLHLIRWQRALDRACHEELSWGWVHWLGGQSAGEGAWRAFARSEALRQRPKLPVEGPVTQSIAAAAAELLGRGGAGAVTHRGVARQAGISLGTVLYHCRTSAELIQAAFEAIYRVITADMPFGLGTEGPQSIAEMREGMAAYALNESMPAQLLAMEELFCAAARDDSYLPFAAVVRYTRGQTTERQYAHVRDTRWPIMGVDAMLMSVWSQGLRRDTLAAPERERDRLCHASLDTMFELVGEVDR